MQRSGEMDRTRCRSCRYGCCAIIQWWSGHEAFQFGVRGDCSPGNRLESLYLNANISGTADAKSTPIRSSSVRSHRMTNTYCDPFLCLRAADQLVQQVRVSLFSCVAKKIALAGQGRGYSFRRFRDCDGGDGGGGGTRSHDGGGGGGARPAYRASSVKQTTGHGTCRHGRRAKKGGSNPPPGPRETHDYRDSNL